MSGMGVVVVVTSVVTAVLAGYFAYARRRPVARVPGRYVVPLDGRPSAFAYASLPLEATNLLVVAASTSVLAIVTRDLSEPVPIHWSLSGQPDRWGSPQTLLVLPAIQASLTLLLWTVLWAVTRERWALPEAQAERYARLQVERRTLIVRMVEVLTLGINVSLTAIALATVHDAKAQGQGSTPAGVLAASVLLCVTLLGSTIAFLPRLSAVQDELETIGGSSALGTRNAGWKANDLIYYAPDDPAVFVPKRIGIGLTVNFARPAAWLFLAFVIGGSIAITVVAVRFSQP